MTETWSETDALDAARKGPSLAQIMLANRPELAAEIARTAPATVEQIVTAAEVVAEVVAEAEQIAQDAAKCACASGSCKQANWWTPCNCHCGGHAHGDASRAAYQAGLAKAAARRDDLYDGDPFGGLPMVDLDELATVPVQRRAIPLDADGWPID